MSQRLPRGNYRTAQLTDANLSDYALAVVNGLTAAAGVYPAPPIPPATLQATLNDYNTALAASIGGSRVQRATMRTFRQTLRAQIAQDGQYVNQVTWANVQAGQSYESASEDIVSSGYQLGLNPSPVGDLPEAIIKKFSSPNKGVLYVLVIKIHGAKSYILSYGLTGTDPSTWRVQAFPNTRINAIGLTSGQTYDFNVYGKGASNGAINYSDTYTQVII